MTDPNKHQVGGDHYLNKAVQPWAAMESWMTHEQFVGFLLGSAIAYLARYNDTTPMGKGGLRDLRKSRHYLDKLISIVDGSDHEQLDNTR